MGAYGDRVVHLLAIIGTVTSYVVTLVFHGLAYSDAGIRIGLFRNRTDLLWEKYITEVTPNGWAFIGVWSGVYVYQALWLGYGISLIFRRGINGYLYTSPAIIPCSLYAAFTINMLVYIVWLFVWDCETIIAALLVRIVMCAALYACLIISYRALQEHGQNLINHGMIWELLPVMLILQNALGLYAAWMTLSTLISLAVVLTYAGPLSVEDASTVALVLILIILLTWFFSDVFLLDKYTRMTTPPYVITCTVLGAIIDRKFVAGGRNSTLIAVILAIGVLLAVSKFAISIVRRFKTPLWVRPVEDKPCEDNPGFRLPADDTVDGVI